MTFLRQAFAKCQTRIGTFWIFYKKFPKIKMVGGLKNRIDYKVAHNFSRYFSLLSKTKGNRKMNSEHSRTKISILGNVRIPI